MPQVNCISSSIGSQRSCHSPYSRFAKTQIAFRKPFLDMHILHFLITMLFYFSAVGFSFVAPDTTIFEDGLNPSLDAQGFQPEITFDTQDSNNGLTPTASGQFLEIFSKNSDSVLFSRFNRLF